MPCGAGCHVDSYRSFPLVLFPRSAGGLLTKTAPAESQSCLSWGKMVCVVSEKDFS